MKLDIKFLQTGGVPLTNDLMDNIMDAIKLYDVVGDLAGHMTIIAGCDFVPGSTTTVNPGVVSINGEVLVFEGGLMTTNVFINEVQIAKNFQDQTSKVLINKRTVKFGNATAPNLFVWADFKKLSTLKEMQIALGKKAEQTQVDDIEERLAIVELKTAPIVNGGIVWAWRLPTVPTGWKIATSLEGKTVIGLDPNDPPLSVLGSLVGSNTHKITANELPVMQGQFQTLSYDTDNGSGISTAISATPASVGGSSGQWRHKQIKIQFGGGQDMSVIQAGEICHFIEPNFQ